MTLLIGPPASGKTAFCLQRLHTRQAEQPLRRVRVLLPDRSQVFTFQRRLAAAGGGLGVHLETFGELHAELLQRGGRLLPLAQDSALFRVLRALARQAAAEGALPHYAAIVETPGFINALADRFAELKRERVLPEQFLDQTDPATAGEHELAALYDRYQRHLQQRGWADREGQAWLAVEMLQHEPHFAPGFDLLVVDGFNEFTPVQVALLQALRKLSQPPEILITLTGASGAPRSAHGRFNRARRRLERALQPQVRFLEDSHLTPALAALEAGFFEPAPQPFAGHSPEVQLLELRAPADEAREALRWIKALLVRQTPLAIQHTAVFTPDLDLHLPYLKTAAAEFGLPLHVRFREPLTSSPAIQALTDLLELPLAGYPRRLVLETVRSPFFDLQAFDLQRADAAYLEALSFDYQIVGGLEQWRQAFAAARERSMSELAEVRELFADPDEKLPFELPEAADRERIQRGFESFFAGFLPPPAENSLGGWLQWLDRTLAAVRYEDCAPPPVLAGLISALDQLLLSEELLPADRTGASLPYHAFLQELLAALQGQGVLLERVEQDQGVFVAPLIEARGLRFEAVALLGLAEGIFPAVERADPFLGEDLRRRLGMETRLGRFQSSLFYQAALRSSRFLLLTRPYLAEGGEPWQPSPYWQSLVEIFPDGPSRLRPSDPRQPQHAASAAEALFWQARRPIDPTALPVDLQHKTGVLAARLAKTAAGPYEGQPLELQALFAARYGEAYLWSASRFETYGGCPHRFYTQYALDLQPLVPPKPGYEPSHLGSILHELLEQAYRRARPPDDPQAVLDALHTVAGGVFAAAPERYGFRPGPLWEIEQTQLLELLEANIQALAAEGEAWQPVAFEARFGLQDQPPLELMTPAGRVLLRGLIDRVDSRPGGGVRVIDYKTGSSHLAPRDLLEGVRLQLPIYAAAAEALGLGQPVDGFYWYLGGARAGSLRLGRFEAESATAGVEGALEVVTEHLAASLEGIRQGQFTPRPPSGGCPDYCPAAAWCWRYESRGY